MPNWRADIGGQGGIAPATDIHAALLNELVNEHGLC